MDSDDEFGDIDWIAAPEATPQPMETDDLLGLEEEIPIDWDQVMQSKVPSKRPNKKNRTKRTAASILEMAVEEELPATANDHFDGDPFEDAFGDHVPAPFEAEAEAEGQALASFDNDDLGESKLFEQQSGGLATSALGLAEPSAAAPATAATAAAAAGAAAAVTSIPAPTSAPAPSLFLFDDPEPPRKKVRTAEEATFEKSERKRRKEVRGRAVEQYRMLLLALIARSQLLNSICNDEFVQAVAFSVEPHFGKVALEESSRLAARRLGAAGGGGVLAASAASSSSSLPSSAAAPAAAAAAGASSRCTCTQLSRLLAKHSSLPVHAPLSQTDVVEALTGASPAASSSAAPRASSSLSFLSSSSSPPSSSSSSSPPPLSAVYPLSYCSCPSRRLQLLHAMGKSGDAAPSHEDLVLARLAQLRAAGRLARLVVSFPLPSPTTCLVLLDRRQQLPHPEAWLEVFDPTGRRWTAEGLPERAPGRSKSMLWILACSGSGSIRDVTRRYSDRWSSVLAARGSLQRVWASVTDRHAEPSKGTADEHDEEEGLEDLSSMQQSLAAARADLLDEEDLLRRAKREPIPTSKAAFKRHATYILDSQLRPQDMLWPATAKPVGLFRGQEKVWLRANVLELRTSTQWRRLGRVVKHGEEPTKVLNSSSAFASKLYSEAQTEALPEVADARTLGASFDGDIPVFPGANAFGNFELLDAVAIDRLPRDLAYVPENFARPIASKMGLSFAPAVVGFTREGSNPKPKYGGIVLWRDDLEALEVELAKERKRVEDLAREKRNEQLKSAWKALVKHVLVDLYVEDRYSKASSSHRPQRSRAADGHELLADVL